MIKNILFIVFVFCTFSIYAQTDSVVFVNGNYIVGEVKKMDRNVVDIKTKYSDKDFQIKWDGIKEIYTNTFFLITTSDGKRYNGSLKSSSKGKVFIIINDENQVEVDLASIVYLDDIDKGFWSKLYFSLDVGLDLTKANNLAQFSTRSTLGYKAKRWNLGGKYNTLFSHQEGAEDIRNVDGGIDFKYFMRRDLYPLVNLNFLSSTEQKLDLRTTTRAGLGKFLTHTNHLYWGISLGITYNVENYTEAAEKRESWEGFMGTELNLFNIGDLDLLTKLVAYPSFTEKGRWRSDFIIDAKYEMPFDDDLYIKVGATINYDNRPAEGATETDYILHSGFGWQW